MYDVWYNYRFLKTFIYVIGYCIVIGHDLIDSCTLHLLLLKIACSFMYGCFFPEFQKYCKLHVHIAVHVPITLSVLIKLSKNLF